MCSGLFVEGVCVCVLRGEGFRVEIEVLDPKRGSFFQLLIRLAIEPCDLQVDCQRSYMYNSNCFKLTQWSANST